jgi:Rv0078B-related antitoxin
MRKIDPRRIELLDPVVKQVLQSKTPEERLHMAFELNRTARKFMAAGLRSQHPEWTEEQVQQEIARRIMNGAT